MDLFSSTTEACLITATSVIRSSRGPSSRDLYTTYLPSFLPIKSHEVGTKEALSVDFELGCNQEPVALEGTCLSGKSRPVV